MIDVLSNLIWSFGSKFDLVSIHKFFAGLLNQPRLWTISDDSPPFMSVTSFILLAVIESLVIYSEWTIKRVAPIL